MPCALCGQAIPIFSKKERKKRESNAIKMGGEGEKRGEEGGGEKSEINTLKI